MSYIFAIAVFIIVLTVMMLVLRRYVVSESVNRRDKILKTISQESENSKYRSTLEDIEVFKKNAISGDDKLDQILMKIPGFSGIHKMAIKAGLQNSALKTFIMLFGVFITLVLLASQIKLGSIGTPILILVAVVVSYMGPRAFLRGRINKRNQLFIDQFPDAIDMIVRSVRSGHPINAALRMIAENMPAPVSTEFKKVVDEISYGRTLTEALYRLAARIEETDINFFVVVLVVQQETGGNLAEVLSNLSNIIRKRKQLRLKIRAITSEARITTWVMAVLPLILMLVLNFITPGYLDPLFDKEAGRLILATAVGLVASCVFVIRRMIKIDI